MDILLQKHRLLNILTISLPLFFCFLLSTSTSPTPTPSLSAASRLLRQSGYSLFASSILSSSNLSGTLFAPPDFAFRRPPSTSLLLFHTLKPPPLSSLNLSSPHAYPTLLDDLCLFITVTRSGHIAISSSPTTSGGVKVRHPNLYVDDHLTVHGIDGVLDPSTALKCQSSKKKEGAPIESRAAYALSYLDHAVRVLKKRGFNFAATALAVKRAEVLGLKAVTVFAPSDQSLFSNGGFRYDFLHHVVPQRLRLEQQTAMAFQTLAPNKSVIVEAVNGSVRVDGLEVDAGEIYRNRWIVVFGIPTTLDDAVLPIPPPESANQTAIPVAPPMEAAPPCSTRKMPIGLEGGANTTIVADWILQETDRDEGEPSDGFCQLMAESKEAIETDAGSKDDDQLNIADDMVLNASKLGQS